MSTERRRRRLRRVQTDESTVESGRMPSPSDLAELDDTFAMTVGVHDGEEAEPPGTAEPAALDLVAEPVRHLPEDIHTERGLRGLVGGGSSQVSVGAALRARDAARPTEADLARAQEELVIIRRGWVPREDLPARPRR